MALTGYDVATVALAGTAVALATRPPPRLRGTSPSPRWRLPGPLSRSGPPETGRGLRVGAGLVAGAVTVMLLLGPLGIWAVALAVPVGLAVAEMLARLPSGKSRRRERDLVQQTPQALDLLAAALDAGLPLRSATAAVVRACPGPVAEEWAAVLRHIELGVGEVEAWRGLRRHPQLGAVASELARSVESGTMLGAALVVHAEEARAVRTAAVEVAARKVGVRSVMPLMLCFIPAFLLLGIVPTLVSAVLAALAPR